MTNSHTPSQMVIRRSSSGAGVGLLFSFGFLALIVFGMVTARDRFPDVVEGPLLTVLGVGGLMALFCGLYLTKRLLSREPLITLNENGILDQSGLLSVGKLRWDEISGVEPRIIGHQLFIELQVVRPSEVISRQPYLFKRFLLRWGLRRGWGVAMINPEVLAMPTDDIVAEIRRRLASVRNGKSGAGSA